MPNMTKVYLLNVPLENDYKNTFHFQSKSEQIEYFKTRIIKESENFTYIRKDNIIRYPDTFDNLLNCNYVMYRNTDYSDKWFYAFITDMKYINDGRTDIYIETDCMQTWYFDKVLKSSFVEREHVSNDTIGLHTVPEQLETGDYIVNNRIDHKKLKYRAYVIGATVDLTSSSFPNVEGEIYNGIYSGVRYYYYTDTATIGSVLKNLAAAGKSDAIVSIFMVPKDFVTNSANKVTMSFDAFRMNWTTSGDTEFPQEQIYKPTTLNGYTPKNNKLLTYPYCYLMMSNNSGADAIYKYELFDKDSHMCDFEINFAITPGCSIRLIPKKYNGVDLNNSEGLTSGKYPTCAWANDVYTNWLTQNAINIPVQLASGAFSSISGGVTGAASGAAAGAFAGPAGAVIGGVGGAISGVAGGMMSIASTVGEIYAHSIQPPQSAGNLNSGDVSFSNGDLTFSAYQMSLKSEYAKIIDGFFTMYGYKVNRVKIPNTNHRSRFWYTKTIDVNIDGSIPQKDMQIIKNCYNNGITFWKDTSDINNYSSTNAII